MVGGHDIHQRLARQLQQRRAVRLRHARHQLARGACALAGRQRAQAQQCGRVAAAVAAVVLAVRQRVAVVQLDVPRQRWPSAAATPTAPRAAAWQAAADAQPAASAAAAPTDADLSALIQHLIL